MAKIHVAKGGISCLPVVCLLKINPAKLMWFKYSAPSSMRCLKPAPELVKRHPAQGKSKIEVKDCPLPLEMRVRLWSLKKRKKLQVS